MLTIEVRLTSTMRVCRRLGDLDTIEIEGPTGKIVLLVDARAATVAADLGAGLLAASRRQTDTDPPGVAASRHG